MTHLGRHASRSAGVSVPGAGGHADANAASLHDCCNEAFELLEQVMCLADKLTTWYRGLCAADYEAALQTENERPSRPSKRRLNMQVML